MAMDGSGLSASDVAMLSNGGFGDGNAFLWIFALLILANAVGQNQIYSLFAIPLLALYSGKRGKANLKYFFYIFYPLHLVVIQAISMII